MSRRRVSGKDALILLVEEQMGLQDFDESKINYLKNKAKQFYLYLCKQMHEWQAREIIDGIIERTRKELGQHWQDAFIMDAQREYSSTEIDIMSKEGTDPEGVLTQEFYEELEYRERLAKIADSHAEGNKNWERWKRALEHLQDLENKLELLETIKACQGELTEKERKLAHGLVVELRLLRFGSSQKRRYLGRSRTDPKIAVRVHETKVESMHKDGIYISKTRWIKLQNRLNKLIGVEKQYKEIEFEKRESEDLLDHADYVDPDFLNSI